MDLLSLFLFSISLFKKIIQSESIGSNKHCLSQVEFVHFKAIARGE